MMTDTIIVTIIIFQDSPPQVHKDVRAELFRPDICVESPPQIPDDLAVFRGNIFLYLTPVILDRFGTDPKEIGFEPVYHPFIRLCTSLAYFVDNSRHEGSKTFQRTTFYFEN